MKKRATLRMLNVSMDDSYTIEELYATFEGEVFSNPKNMDIGLIKETVFALDARGNEEVAPHMNYVWQMIQQRIQNQQKISMLRIPKRRLVVLVAVLILLLTAIALAFTYVDELRAVWDQSFHRMNTTGTYNAVPMEEFDLKGFEEQYTANTGLDQKEDLVLSTIPEEGDLPYEKAYQIARAAIIAKFGTPEDELGEMGIYPSFIQGVYETDYSKWEFYFTPRKNVNIDEDHSYDPPGEYRVEIQSPSGEVTMCNWYIDAFWPEYAMRTWNAGKYDYVWSEAIRGQGGFFQQSAADQDLFRQLFQEKGYDVSSLDRTDEEKLASVSLEIMFSDPSLNLLNTGDPVIEAAIAYMEKQYGMDKTFMNKAAFCAIRSPLGSETVDICFSYNYEIGSRRINDGEWGYGVSLLGNYSSRFGIYMVCLDPVSLEPVHIVHCLKNTETESSAELLLERKNWAPADVCTFINLMDELQQLDDQYYVYGTITEGKLQIQCDVIMRQYGGSKDRYPREPLHTEDITEKEALRFAIQYLADQNGWTTKDLEDHYPVTNVFYDSQWRHWCVCFYAGPMEETGIAEEIWIDVETGEVSIPEDDSNG